MKTTVRILVVLAASAALILLVVWTVAAFGVHGPVFPFLANWLVMAWMAIAGQVQEFGLPAGYYRLREFERDGRIYEFLGVQWFKKLVRAGPLTVFAPTLRTQHKITTLDGAGLARLGSEMCKAECAHLFIGLVVLLLAVYAASKGWWDTAGWLLLFDIPINAYPVMLQRYNRGKMQPLLEAKQVE